MLLAAGATLSADAQTQQHLAPNLLARGCREYLRPGNKQQHLARKAVACNLAGHCCSLRAGSTRSFTKLLRRGFDFERVLVTMVREVTRPSPSQLVKQGN